MSASGLLAYCGRQGVSPTSLYFLTSVHCIAAENESAHSALKSLRGSLTDSHQQLSTAQAQSMKYAQACESAQQQAESLQSQLTALLDSSAAEVAAVKQQVSEHSSTAGIHKAVHLCLYICVAAGQTTEGAIC